MSYESKLDIAIQLIKDHNSILSSLKDKTPSLLDPDAFIYGVKVGGGTLEASLKHFTHEDICGILKGCYKELNIHDNTNPIALARSICEKFRSNQEEVIKPLSDKKIKVMTIDELCRNYDYNDASSTVFNRLRDLSQSRSFLVFDSSDKVIVEHSVKLLKEIMDGFPPRETFVLGGEVWKVYKVGDKPPKIFDENPIFVGRALRPDDSCDQTNRSWEGITIEVRQLVRLISQESETTNLKFAHDIMDMVMEMDAPKRLLVRYPHVAAKFKELKKLGKLPGLKISSVSTVGKFPAGKPVKII